MPRTSFTGALATMALGAVLAFAIQSNPRDFDLRTAGVILILAGAGDLVIRFLISESPLLGRPAADVAAVVEPVGDPVLDAAGNPVVVPNPAAAQGRPPLISPLPGSMPEGSAAEALVVTDDGVTRIPAAPAEPTPAADPVPGAAEYQTMPYGAVREEAPVAVTTLGGRPVRPRGRGFIRARRGSRQG